jgi:hypothetical protein
MHPTLVSRQPTYVPQVLSRTRPVGPPGMTRSPIAVWLFLPIVTLGIYTLVWRHKLNRTA